MTPEQFAKIVPGGILPTDFRHFVTNDGSCSRCRKLVPEEQVPIIAWMHGGNTMLIYCDTCCGIKPCED
jgi:hypothetical protein